jgi:hypothetical protein
LSDLNIPNELIEAVTLLWQIEWPETAAPRHGPAFKHLVETCCALFPDVLAQLGRSRPDKLGVDLALQNALANTGTPWPLSDGTASFPPSPASVAKVIVDAMNLKEIDLVHLCPLDCLDDTVPDLRFGPCEVRSLSPAELDAIVHPARLRRHATSWTFDSRRFAQFTWLIVRERRPVLSAIGKRAGSIFPFRADEDFGAIQPHASDFPEIVDRALFALLLMPWEEIGRYKESEWRGFRTPLVYTIDPDPFARPKAPPDPDRLSWQPDFVTDSSTGEDIEYERPIRFPLSDEVETTWSGLNENWQQLSVAYGTKLFNPLVQHFLLRAFSADGVDEFLFHITTIEAALGMPRDFNPRERPPVDGKNPGATARIARRVAALTEDPEAKEVYHALFELRSAFVHGKHLDAISGEERRFARALARRVAHRLVQVASQNREEDRAEYLSRLCS